MRANSETDTNMGMTTVVNVNIGALLFFRDDDNDFTCVGVVILGIKSV